jgi:ornithine cyclodeaminase/alanine dehydrogenase
MRFLSDADVARLLPPPLELGALARDALLALAQGEADVPAKPAVHTGGGSFANAMPAAYPARKLLGCKWISIFPDNPAAGLPTASGLMVVNDGDTGLPRTVLEAATLTAARTAAVSGACIAGLGRAGKATAILGAGVQARSHLRVLEALGTHDVTVHARRVEARQALSAWAATETPAVRLRVVDTREAAVRSAGVVVTALSIGLSGAHLDPGWFADDALILPLDYASSVGPDVASSGVLAADHVPQFEAVRSSGVLGDYPATTRWTGELLDSPESASGRTICQNLGNGLSDLVVADAVAVAAEAQDAGQLLVTTSP